MKILIVYSSNGKLEEYARSLCKGAESVGHQVTLKTTVNSGDLISCHSYDLFLLGSPVNGMFGGKISEDVEPFLSNFKRTEGKEVIAFSDRKIFGTDKALRNLMGLMESQGCIVKDFRGFRSANEAFEYGKQI